MRTLLAVLLSIFAAFVAITLIEIIFIPLIYPMPDGTSWTDTASMQSYINNAPTSAKIIVILSWAIGAILLGFISGLVATGSGKKTATLISAAIYIIVTILNLSQSNSPVWMWVIGIALWIPLALWGLSLSDKVNKSSS